LKCRIENRILRFTEWTSGEIAEVDKRLTWIHSDGTVEKLLFESNDGRPATFWGLHRILETVCPFPIELENPIEVQTTSPLVKPDVFEGVTLYDHQVAAVRKALMLRNGLNIIPTGGGKTKTILAVIRHLLDAKQIENSLIVVPTVNLSEQFYSDAIDCGFAEKDLCIVSGKSKLTGSPKILIGVVNSLSSKLQEGGNVCNYIVNTDALFFDEVQHLRAETFRSIAHSVTKAKYLLGYSGSPFTDDVASVLRTSGDALVYGLAGPPIFAIGYRYLVEAGYIAEPVILFKKTPGSFLKYHKQFEKIYSAFIVHNKDRNEYITQYATKFVRLGFKVLILVQRLKHAELLMKELKEFRVVAAFGGGKGLVLDPHTKAVAECTLDFETVRQQFAEGAFEILIGSQVMDEGVDIPSIGAVILGGAGKSRIKNIQRLGRGLRRKSGVNRVYLVDFYDTSHVYLTAQSKKRKALFTEIEATLIDNEDFFWKEVINHAAQSKED